MAKEERKGVSTLGEFEQAIDLLVKLYEKDSVRFRVWLPANVDLLIDESTIKELIESKEMVLGRFQDILDNEISIIISALVSDNTELFIDVYYPRICSDDEDDKEEGPPQEEIIAEAKKKVELCEERFDFLPTVEAQFKIKYKSSLNVFKKMYWDTSVKEYKKGDRTEKVQMATLQFILQKQPVEIASAYRFFPFLPYVQTLDESVAFDCHLNDVKSLIEVLNKVINSLSKEVPK